MSSLRGHAEDRDVGYVVLGEGVVWENFGIIDNFYHFTFNILTVFIGDASQDSGVTAAVLLGLYKLIGLSWMD